MGNRLLFISCCQNSIAASPAHLVAGMGTACITYGHAPPLPLAAFLSSNPRSTLLLHPHPPSICPICIYLRLLTYASAHLCPKTRYRILPPGQGGFSQGLGQGPQPNISPARIPTHAVKYPTATYPTPTRTPIAPESLSRRIPIAPDPYRAGSPSRRIPIAPDPYRAGSLSRRISTRFNELQIPPVRVRSGRAPPRPAVPAAEER